MNSIPKHMFEGHMIAEMREQIMQDEANTKILAVAGEETGKKLIRIISKQPHEKRLALSEKIIDSLAAGCDYSHCETAEDMAAVYRKYLIDANFGGVPPASALTILTRGLNTVQKPTNRRSYKEVCKLYESRGLTDYMLRTTEDIKAIHNFDITQTEGYSDLTDENKRLYADFMISFMNGLGMNTKIRVFPRRVNFVRKLTYLKECPPDPEDGKIYKEEIGVKFLILKANGKTKTLLKAGYFDRGKTAADATHTRAEEFLRADLLVNGEKNWFHVFSADRYY